MARIKPERHEGVVISGRDARGGEIVLRSRRRRAIFLAGLAGLVLLALVVWFAGLAS